MSKIILGIETSCDDTSVGLVRDGKILANVTRLQVEHEDYGGVVPELASRAHLRLITRVTEKALETASVTFEQIDAIACTRGPGLPGALMVGVAYAKGLSLALDKPLIGVHHMEAHIQSLWTTRNDDHRIPQCPFICLLVSGGHTYLVLVENPTRFKIIGKTLDDAAGEAFDKTAKLLGLGYPGGARMDRLAESGNPNQFVFSRSRVDGYNFSFSGIKTSVLYFLQEKMKQDDQFIEKNLSDLCASIRQSIVDMLLEKTRSALHDFNLPRLGITGGVAANNLLRREAQALVDKLQGNLYIPDFEFCTDNGGMIALSGWFRLLLGKVDTLDLAPDPSFPWAENIIQ